MDIINKKSRIIKIVEELQNDNIINWLLKILEVLKILPANSSFTPPPITPQKQEVDKQKEAELAALMELARQPTPDHIPLEQLMKEQNYDPKNLAETLKNWDYSLFDDDPSIEEILKMKI